MSKKRGLSVEEKRTRMMEIFFETKDVFQLKDIEKIAPKEKGITAMSVKEVLQSLVDDGMVDTDRIGTSNYFWAFPSKALHARKRKLEELQNEHLKVLGSGSLEDKTDFPYSTEKTREQLCKDILVLGHLLKGFAIKGDVDRVGAFSEYCQKKRTLEESIEKSKIGRQDTAERAALTKELTALRQKKDQLKAEIDKYKECDPDIVEEIRQANKVAKEAANRWTDNIFAVKSWAKRKFGFEDGKIDKTFGIPEDFDYID